MTCDNILIISLLFLVSLQPSHYVTITTPHDQTDAADKAEKTARIKQLVGQLQNNLCNVSVMSDPDLDSLSNMDPNSLVDITGKDFMEQLKDSGRLGGEAQMWMWLSSPVLYNSHTSMSLCSKFFFSLSGIHWLYQILSNLNHLQSLSS